ncbi:efflux RND transporter periplasmic adaptor subunit [Candidatus Falkowbacteria bacterium]|jgi:RND family efflux transporter MFP subunit|nr:efflux RND transporter periplasmic adaptor subunit [Candidatus Falkowbacteria bacterium]MBT7007067.1 efflux RND transporter periplasmic adaptor subunit [Candidatus Falkowbacteria bacterium]
MLENNPVEKIVNLDEFGEKPFFKRKSTIWGAVVVVILLILVGSAIAKNGNQEEIVNDPIAKQVETLTVGDNTLNNFIQSVGVVKPETQIDVVALTRGTVEGVFVNEGDQILAYTTVGRLYDGSTIASYNTATNAVTNAHVSYSSTDAVTQESVAQAELGVESAQIAYDNALANFENSTQIRDNSNDDLMDNAVISYGGFMNNAYSALDQVDYLLKIEGNRQLSGVGTVLGLKNPQAMNDAPVLYWNAKTKYNSIQGNGVNIDNVEVVMDDIIEMFLSLKELVDLTIVIIDNTPTNTNFTSTQLNAQKTAFSALRNQVVSQTSQALTTLSSIQNIPFSNNQSNLGLQQAVDSAKKQLEMAQVSLENAKQSRDLQLNSAKSALDGANGQLALAQNQLSYLTLRSSISGTVTSVTVEPGDQINPGQAFATVANTNMMKVELDLPVSEAAKILPGQTAFIDGDLNGFVHRVYPAADPVTKKVRVEVIYDNANQDLIAETYVDVDIVAETETDSTQTTFFVPLKSVTIGQSESYVFIVDSENKAQKIPVIIGQIMEDKIEIVEGLRLDDKLIIDGNKWLQGGESVDILSK